MTIIKLLGHLDFISCSPTLASVELLLFEQPDSDLDSLLHKKLTKEIHYVCARRSPFQKLRQNIDNLVVLLKRWLFEDCAEFFIPLPEFVKCKPSFQSFYVVVLLSSLKS